jgi:hypothetical protein
MRQDDQQWRPWLIESQAIVCGLEGMDGQK